MTEVQGTRGRVLHWARKANYSKEAIKDRKEKYRVTPQFILPGKKGERQKREPNYQKEMSEHLQGPIRGA
jgi:transposase InsO family protein